MRWLRPFATLFGVNPVLAAAHCHGVGVLFPELRCAPWVERSSGGPRTFRSLPSLVRRNAPVRELIVVLRIGARVGTRLGVAVDTARLAAAADAKRHRQIIDFAGREGLREANSHTNLSRRGTHGVAVVGDACPLLRLEAVGVEQVDPLDRA